MVSAFNLFNPMGAGAHFGFGFGLHNVMFTLISAIIFITIFVTLIKGISQWNKNNQSPRLTVPATIIAKRTNVSHHHHGGDHHNHHTSTSYYVTFEVESGDRMEFLMAGHEYGLLMEGDKGKLSFQGTRYLGFERV